MPPLLAAWLLLAALPYPALPDWTSADLIGVGTGGALVDLDRDGWLDLVVANGNDIYRQPLSVYYNRGDGSLPAVPDWSSTTLEYHGHLSIGDVDQDGWPDVAVAVYLGPAGFGDPGHAALYLNDGTGGLPASPSWRSSESFHCFEVALGDGDSDGDLDLAVAVGDPYVAGGGQNLLYRNEGGALSPTAGWRSAEAEVSLGVAWGDADDDGDLDLAFGADQAPHRIYLQTAGQLSTTSDWASAAPGSFGLWLDFGDLDRDGRSDLLLASDDPGGGFHLFPGTGSLPATRPSWTARYSGYPSHAAFGDVEGDGWLDLICGGWGTVTLGDPMRIYSNRYDRLPDLDPSFASASSSVIERAILGDVNRDGLESACADFAGDGARRLFRLPHRPVHALLRVRADGIDLGPADFAFQLEPGWLSLRTPPAVSLEIDYLWSRLPDLAVINWDDDQGNHLYHARPAVLLHGVKGATLTEPRLTWSAGRPPYEVLESGRKDMGPPAALRAVGLAATEWSDAPGTLGTSGVRYYRVH